MEKSDSASVSPSRAAFLAGRQYVYRAAYGAGFASGWEQGWMDAMREDRADPMHGEEEEALFAGVPDPPNSEDVKHEFELSEEWAAIFASGSSKRNECTELEYHDKREIIKEQLDLGGRSVAEKEGEACALYGRRSREVLAANAAMDAHFSRACSEVQAPLWPAVSLAEVSGCARRPT